MKIVLIWFGAWKNGHSGYAPEWVMKDFDRFPRMQIKDRLPLEVISNLNDETCNAKTVAFTELLKHIQAVDSIDQTVVMAQIENELGLLGDSRDRSDEAEIAFRADVPAELVQYMEDNKEIYNPS